MEELVKWSGDGGIAFFVKGSEIRGFKDLSISASSDTETKTDGGEKYTSKKNSGSYAITLTAVLNAALGVDVQTLALRMSECARTGSTGYFYVAGAKLFPSMFMCSEAKISAIQLAPNGKWAYCEVKWTLKQCGKYAGSAQSTQVGGTSSGSTSSTKATIAGAAVKLTGAQAASTTGIMDAVKKATEQISAAKAASSKALQSLTSSKKVVGGVAIGGKIVSISKK